jgi:hypothetical protein
LAGAAELSGKRGTDAPAVYVLKDPKAPNFIEFYKKESLERRDEREVYLSVCSGPWSRAQADVLYGHFGLEAVNDSNRTHNLQVDGRTASGGCGKNRRALRVEREFALSSI